MAQYWAIGLAQTWIGFADSACQGYSPLYDRICRAVSASDEVLAIVEAAPPAAHLPNVLLAAVHYCVLGDPGSELAETYAGRPGDDPGRLFVAYCLEHRDEIAELMATRHTNTNEVGRSALIGPLLTETSRRFAGGRPLGLVDVGCSGGLNLLCDRYLLDYGEAGRTGPPGSPVRIQCEVKGRPPIEDSLPLIAGRVGLDRDPVDLSDGTERRWQLALVWPDTGRLNRTRAALALAAEDPPPVVTGDAVDDLPAVLETLPADCEPAVVNTWSFAYLPRERRREFIECLTTLGASRPLTWITLEAPGVVPFFHGVEAPLDSWGAQTSAVGLTRFAGGTPEPLLAGFAHAHGFLLDWRLE